MDFVSLLFSAIALTAIALWLVSKRTNRAVVATMFAILFTAAITAATTAPAIAAPTLGALGARDEAIPGDRQALQENLKVSPTGNHYAGIEYAPRSNQENPLNDAAIESRIESNVTDNLVVSVSNGSVRLDGTVSDRGTAENIVEQIKNIPGVHEVSFDLGLNS
jgi:hypothetical protein